MLNKKLLVSKINSNKQNRFFNDAGNQIGYFRQSISSIKKEICNKKGDSGYCIAF